MIDKLAVRLSQCSAKLKFSLWLLLLCSSLITGLQLWQGGAKIQSDILAMLPKIQEDPLTQTALNRVDKELSNSIYLALLSDSEAQAVLAAQTLISSLNSDKSNTFTQVRSADFNQAEALNSYYFNHRFNLLTPTQEAQLNANKLDSLILQTQQQLYNAFGYASSGLIAKDPLLLYPANLQAMAPKQTLKVQQGILLGVQHASDTETQDKVAAIVMAKGVGSAFNPNIQQQQISVLQQAFDEIHQQDADIKVLKAGALFHASAATQSAKTEVSTLGVASLIGVSLLVWLAFRSVMPLAIALLTIGTSLLIAVVATLAIFSELHLLTLVFGTSLIGIAIDYSFHFYCERLTQPKSNAAQVIQHIFPAITLALITSVLAYSGIGLAPFPGMQQVAVFCAAGLIGAYLTILLAYPLLASGRLPDRSAPLEFAEHYLNRLSRFQARLKDKKSLLLFIVLLVICSLGITRLTTDDDIRNLQQSPDSLLAEEQQLRSMLSGGTDNQFLLVRADSEESLLQSLEQLTPRLNKLIEKGVIGNAFSLTSYLPSQQQQTDNYQLQGKIYHKLDHVLNNLGLDESLQPELEQSYKQAAGKYIDASSFINSDAGQLFAPLWIAADEQQDEFGSIVLLGGITDLATLAKLFPHGSKIQLIDKVGDISDIMGKYRELTLILLAIAMTIAAVIFSTRFSIKLAALVVAVPALSAILTLSLLGLMGSPLTLFHALALILVFGIGVDYSLFFAESKQQSRGVMMAVFMSACSTILAFGLLAFSSTPAIHNFGLTLLLGIVFTFVLSPFIQTFTRTIK